MINPIKFPLVPTQLTINAAGIFAETFSAATQLNEETNYASALSGTCATKFDGDHLILIDACYYDSHDTSGSPWLCWHCSYTGAVEPLCVCKYCFCATAHRLICFVYNDCLLHYGINCCRMCLS